MAEKPSKFTFARLLVLANAVFWLIFAVFFTVLSQPYKPHPLEFEEITLSYHFFGRALPEIDSGTGVALPPPLIKAGYAIQRPSFLAARPFYWYFNSRGTVVDHLYARISVGGYYLIVVCFLSFVQWHLVGRLIDFLRLRLTRKPSTLPASNQGHEPSA